MMITEAQKHSLLTRWDYVKILRSSSYNQCHTGLCLLLLAPFLLGGKASHFQDTLEVLACSASAQPLAQASAAAKKLSAVMAQSIVHTVSGLLGWHLFLQRLVLVLLLPNTFNEFGKSLEGGSGCIKSLEECSGCMKSWRLLRWWFCVPSAGAISCKVKARDFLAADASQSVQQQATPFWIDQSFPNLGQISTFRPQLRSNHTLRTYQEKPLPSCPQLYEMIETQTLGLLLLCDVLQKTKNAFHRPDSLLGGCMPTDQWLESRNDWFCWSRNSPALRAA